MATTMFSKYMPFLLFFIFSDMTNGIYVTNFENMIELTVISLAAVCLSTQEFEEVEKWFSAFGIVLSYIGNFP